MTGALVLPEDIEILPLSVLPPTVRAHVDGGDHDFAVTRPNSRVPSKVIDAQAAKLLREFQTPTTLVDAILRFSKTAQREPAQVLEDVYPFLESCLIARLLVEPGTDSQRIRASFDEGDVVANCQALECVQVLNDTELYRVSFEEHEAALKIARLHSGPHVKQSLEHESKILIRLNGQIAPNILAFGETEDGCSYLVTEWIPGELCGEAAAALRASAYEPLPALLVSLCTRVLDAYAELHGMGVIHSDVHTNNLLVTANGEVRIIDHGLSRVDGDDFGKPLPRGGVGFFFEPEYAMATLAGSTSPLSSRRGEQYSVAALVYLLLTGHYYLDFPYGKEAILRQIIEQLPIPLSARGIPGANALNNVLSRALGKDPASRFPDMAAVAVAFREAAGHLPFSLRHSAAAATPGENGPIDDLYIDDLPSDDRYLRDWLASTLNSLSDPTIDLGISEPKLPAFSLSSGAAGVAFGLFRIACIHEDASLFALAERWLERAENHITPEALGGISPYYSASKTACIQALLAHSAGDLLARSKAMECLLKISDHPFENLDIAVGGSSTLLALSHLVDAFGWDPTTKHKRLIEVGNHLLTDLWRQFDAMAPIGDPKFPTSLAMAHGWAGYLYATLRWIQSAPAPAPRNLPIRLQQLANQSQRNGSRISWRPDTRPNSPVFGGWCNGSAGFVFLWTLAHRLFRDTHWLSLAEGAGQDACFAREEGPSLCCGLTGKAYSQLSLYKHTGDRSWLDNAYAMAKLATQKTEILKRTAASRSPLGLYQGDTGLAVLIADLEHPESAAMPLFEDEAWPRRESRSLNG
jgi:eukaryotic-like serine/threonine-protein kinase